MRDCERQKFVSRGVKGSIPADQSIAQDKDKTSLRQNTNSMVSPV